MKKSELREGMELEVTIQGNVVCWEKSGDRVYLIREGESNMSNTCCVPIEDCVPVIPDYEYGDLVEHIHSGARGTVYKFSHGTVYHRDEYNIKYVLIEIPHTDQTDKVWWDISECKIVRKWDE